MALSNKLGAIVLTTGNKSEMATGYCTLYGDMAGGFAVIKDVAKTSVLRNWRIGVTSMTLTAGANTRFLSASSPAPPAQNFAPTKPIKTVCRPTRCWMLFCRVIWSKTKAPKQIVQAGYSQVDVEKVTRLIRINEYKRRQAAVGIRITHRGFGKDWRYPITSHFRS
jgi:NAD+ synthase (glutamine-hydrolysing)